MQSGIAANNFTPSNIFDARTTAKNSHALAGETIYTQNAYAFTDNDFYITRFLFFISRTIHPAESKHIFQR